MNPSSREFFEQLYGTHPDPWQFRTSSYERSRYSEMLSVLGRERYVSTFEPGCANGEFTALIAPRCDRLMAMDISAIAVAEARRRCAAYPHVVIMQGDLKRSIAEGPFDLIIFSELGYYFEREDLAVICGHLSRRLAPGGELVAVHWLGNSADHRLHGDVVHEILRGNLGLKHQTESRYPEFRIDSWTTNAP